MLKKYLLIYGVLFSALPKDRFALVGGGCIAWDIRRPLNPQPRDRTGILTRISIPEKIVNIQLPINHKI